MMMKIKAKGSNPEVKLDKPFLQSKTTANPQLAVSQQDASEM